MVPKEIDAANFARLMELAIIAEGFTAHANLGEGAMMLDVASDLSCIMGAIQQVIRDDVYGPTDEELLDAVRLPSGKPIGREGHEIMEIMLGRAFFVLFLLCSQYGIDLAKMAERVKAEHLEAGDVLKLEEE